MKDNAYGTLTINLGAVADNYTYFQNKVGHNCAVAGVLKANAYGLGLSQILKCLEKKNCRQYFVATPDEALELRSLTTKPIFLLGGIFKGAEKEYVQYRITPVLNSFEDIKLWSNQAKKEGTPLNAIIHFDTGMNRLGLGKPDTQALINDTSCLKNLQINMIMSHFACADEKSHPLNNIQFEAFNKISHYFPKAKRSLANSSGIMRSNKYHYDLVRPGMGVYGLNPTPENINPMKDVVTLNIKILQLRDVKKGQSIGYSATHRFKNNRKVATVGFGYADGLPRSASNKALLYYKGVPCPIIGRISMDLVSVDMGTHIVNPGDMIEVIGESQNADALAKSCGTIGYEILTNLGHRYHRDYKKL